MYNLAIYNAANYSTPTSIKVSEFYFKDVEQLLSHIDNIHGVIIYTTNDEHQNNVLELILTIKRHCSLPIWVRNETEQPMSKNLNLELGVLGNLDATISNEEMFAMIENTLELLNPISDESITNNNPSNQLQLNSLNCSMKLPNKAEVCLTRLEYKMMSLLATRMNQAFTYEEIYQCVWSEDRESDNSIRKYRTSNLAFHIRNKLSHHGINPKILRTVRSVGYLLDSNIESSFIKEVMQYSS
ncbi:response regulator transcription factor [Candidatus Enterococcus ikei]|uniref:Response regulator transcription factor n=1 Tax=Candidatus Enterococcus ikei TaxID=2815326 RepID=A0ABS3H145_9ENTE|nr:winged helix-turn-helix domain-containing protein [Enterococcus sp. DIV0869a]MBO0441228.1 response regulator transcription factor [Enterococcus sp. DIV0869a]